MKVILISDVENVGVVGDVKDVKNGMARNYLFPRKLAIKATESNLKAWKSKIEAIKLRKTEVLENAQAFAEKLEGLEISIPAKAGEEDRLFGVSYLAEHFRRARGKRIRDLKKGYTA